MVAQWYDLRFEPYRRTRRAGDPGFNPALGKKRSESLDQPIDSDVPAALATPQATLPEQRLRLRSLMLTIVATNLKKLSTGANGKKEDAAFFFCPGREVLIKLPVS